MSAYPNLIFKLKSILSLQSHSSTKTCNLEWSSHVTKYFQQASKKKKKKKKKKKSVCVCVCVCTHTW